MFGNDNDQSQDNMSGAPAPTTSLGNSVFPPVGTPVPAAPVEPSGPPTTLPTPTTPAASPLTPTDSNHMTLDELADSVGAKPDEPAVAADPAYAPAEPAAATTTDVSAPSSASSNDDELLNIKQQALQNLSPLVSKLDQTPLEKFKTTMMMIQASDDQSLIKTAYEAAKQITDEKEKAQALLDIVNEINYFTQHAEE